ncbi:MAG: galactokinase family protein [Vicinamibacterales bacterium]
MTEAVVAARFVAAGFDEHDVPSRVALVGAVTAHLREWTGRRAEAAWFVPGRIEIVGKHTDYAGGRSLVAAVPRGITVAAAPRSDGVVRVYDLFRQGSVQLDPLQPSSPLPGWGRYVEAVARRFARNFAGAASGVDLVIRSDLPGAAGLSSSSAMIVAAASALIWRGQLAERPEWRASIRSVEDLAGYLGAVENGQAFCSLDGEVGVGTHGGSEDHTAILLCRGDTVSAYAYAPVRHVISAPMPCRWHFVVMNSGVRADKAGSARDRYNRAALDAGAVVSRWNERAGESHANLAELVRCRPGVLVDWGGMTTDAAAPAHRSHDLLRRLTHFINEDGRVLACADAFARADMADVGAIARASQEEADTLLGNQILETRELASLAVPQGAFAATSFGAGFGGSVWALVEGEAADAAVFLARWRQQYREVCPQHGHASGFVVRPAPGLVELPVS